jgi:hypothetical protein
VADLTDDELVQFAEAEEDLRTELTRLASLRCSALLGEKQHVQAVKLALGFSFQETVAVSLEAARAAHPEDSDPVREEIECLAADARLKFGWK